MKAQTLVWHETRIRREDRERRNGHRGEVVWLTGLSGSGKSTIANLLEERLFEKGVQTYLLDGDNIRHGLNADLGFAHKDREENIRRIAEVAKLFADAGLVTITAFISPFRDDRARARAIMEEDFIEVFVDAPLQTCMQRDPKGLYAKAKRGEIPDFTGLDSPYEAPESPEIHLPTDRLAPEAAAERIVHYLVERGIVS